MGRKQKIFIKIISITWKCCGDRRQQTKVLQEETFSYRE